MQPETARLSLFQLSSAWAFSDFNRVDSANNMTIQRVQGGGKGLFNATLDSNHSGEMARKAQRFFERRNPVSKRPEENVRSAAHAIKLVSD